MRLDDLRGRCRHVDRAAAPIAVGRQIRVRAMQLATPAPTPRARAPPPLAQHHATQRALGIRHTGPKPPPTRQQLPHAQLAQPRTSHQPVSDSLTRTIFLPAADPGDHSRQLDQHLERQRPLRRLQAAIGRRLIQRDVPPPAAIAHIHATGRETTHIQNLEPLTGKRVKRVRDHQRTQRPVGRPRGMT